MAKGKNNTKRLMYGTVAVSFEKEKGKPFMTLCCGIEHMMHIR